MRKFFLTVILLYSTTIAHLVSNTHTSIAFTLCCSRLLIVCWINSICRDNQLIYGYAVDFEYFYLQREKESEKKNIYK